MDEPAFDPTGRAPLRAAMVRFPTIERTRWEPVARALAEMGFNAVDIPLAWREHERAPGVFDFETGNRSVADMLAAVRNAGLRAVVRLGPIASDDVAGLCIPDRVLRERACQARTRRQNPVLVPDPPRMVPLPSVASRAFRAEAERWVRESAGALAAVEARGDVIARIIVGDGPHAAVRDDPYEIDHHPDARGELPGVEPAHAGPQAPGLEEVRRETQRLVAYREALFDAVAAHGFRAASVAVAVPGGVAVSPTAHAVAERHALCLAVPPPLAGSLAIWRQVRHALALAGPRGAHFDFWSGSPPYYPPARGSHTLASARVALAAGARDFTVRMGCAGDRWVGAVLSERGAPRPHAQGWRELLALAADLPHGGHEPGAVLSAPAAMAEIARLATGMHPLPLGLLGLVGLLPGEIATPGTPYGTTTLTDAERELIAAENALLERAVPFARAPEADGDLAARPGEPAQEYAARVHAALADALPTVEPAGHALVRMVRDAGRETLVVQSHREREARVRAPEGDGWSARGATLGDEGYPLAPGATLVLTRAREGADTPQGTLGPEARQGHGASEAPPSEASPAGARRSKSRDSAKGRKKKA